MRRLACALCLIVIAVPGCAAIAAQTVEERGIVTTGTGRVRARPDIAAVALGVEVRTASLADATAQVDRTMRDVLASMKNVGVADADVQTISYSIDPIAEAQERGATGARVVGYRVTNLVQLKTRDVSAVGRIVDTAVGAGANVVRDVHFRLDEPDAAAAQARALAVQDAHERARQVAAAAGVRLGRLLSTSESTPPRPVARMSIATGPGPLEPGELDLIVTVQVRYAIDD